MTQAAIQTCLFCAAAAECNCQVKSRKQRRRSAAPSAQALKAERRAAVAQFVAEVEGRLYRAETDYAFPLEDWEKLAHAMVPTVHLEPSGRRVVRVAEDRWQEICDLLLVEERKKMLAAREAGKPANPKHGPDRYLTHRDFDFPTYRRLLKLVLPEMYARVAPELATTMDPVVDSQRALKVRVMADRYERGEAIHHPDDPGVRDEGGVLPDWLAYLPEGGEVVGNTFLAKEAAEDAKPKPRPSLEGCLEEPRKEFNFHNRLTQPAMEGEWGDRRACRTHRD